MSSPADGRLLQLRTVKLRALVAGRWEAGAPVETGAIPGGATMREAGGRRGWALIDDGDPAGLGATLAWGRRHPVGELHVLVEDRDVPASGIVARRAALFADPPAVWRVQARELVPAVPARPAEGSQVAGGAPTAVLHTLAAQLAAHGATPVIEHGVLRGEVLGLEVARAVQDHDGTWHLAVGVGRHDREARQELRPGEPVDIALEDVVALVRRWRTAGDRRHPSNTLAREKLLRAVVIAHPDLAGARSLSPVPSPLPVEDLRTAAPAGALGVDRDGRPVVVVCSTGVDVDLVPTAADIRLEHAPEARLVLVLPAADAYPLTRDLAAALRSPAEVCTVDEGWPRLAAG